MASTDRDLLLALYTATDGANWKDSTSWGTDADVSQWYGVGVNNQGRVVELALSYNNLRGILGPTCGQGDLLVSDVIDLSHEFGDQRPFHELQVLQEATSLS